MGVCFEPQMRQMEGSMDNKCEWEIKLILMLAPAQSGIAMRRLYPADGQMLLIKAQLSCIPELGSQGIKAHNHKT